MAPSLPWKDAHSGRTLAPVTTGQIYWGAIPFVVIQCIAVAMVILFPQMVMHYKGTSAQVDPSKIDIQIQPPELEVPPLDLR